MALTCEAEETPSCHLIRLVGEADGNEIPSLERAFTRALAARPDAVVVDLSGMTFMSSLGIGSLVTLHKEITRNGGRLRCAGPQPLVAEAFRRVRLYDLLDIRDSLEDAQNFL